VQKQISELQPGELLMLENTRFHPEEDDDNDDFAQELVKGCDFIVFDGFPQAHRAHSSTTGILRHLPSAAGFYFEQEVSSLEKVLDNPEKPMTLIIGGAKISDKVDAVNNLLDKTDFVLLGGGVANVFLKAEGKEMADSLLEDNAVSEEGQQTDWLMVAREIRKRSPEKIQVPLDLIAADNSEKPKEIRELEVTWKNELVPAGFRALDIGSDTIREFFKIIMMSKTIFWSGPLGLFEEKQFAKGTAAIAKAMEIAEATTIIAGGDTIEAAKKYCDTNKITHLSLAGGATLEFLAGKELPVLQYLKKE
jgi:phosphoglycerate kinase